MKKQGAEPASVQRPPDDLTKCSGLDLEGPPKAPVFKAWSPGWYYEREQNL